MQFVGVISDVDRLQQLFHFSNGRYRFGRHHRISNTLVVVVGEKVGDLVIYCLAKHDGTHSG